jgi:hypothetical protein
MVETLYKTSTPEEVPAEKAEYYELILDQEQDANGRMLFFVREMHGWWSEERQQPIHNLKTLSPDEGYSVWKDAFARYQQQRTFRAKGGFVHSFSLHYFGERKYDYRLIEV